VPLEKFAVTPFNIAGGRKLKITKTIWPLWWFKNSCIDLKFVSCVLGTQMMPISQNIFIK
jgi:hypothetical protein